MKTSWVSAMEWVARCGNIKRSKIGRVYAVLGGPFEHVF